MVKMKYIGSLLFALATLLLAAGQPTGTGSTCAPCPNVTSQFFRASGCTAVPDADNCCNSHWTCGTLEERGLTETTCVYDLKTYQVGETVPVRGLCRRGCVCERALQPNQPARIECATVECPETYNNDLEPGCRPTYSHDSCCATGMYCGEDLGKPHNATVVTPQPEASTAAPVASTTLPSAVLNGTRNAHLGVAFEEPACFAEGVEYFKGQKIFFVAQPCRMCTCTDEFSGPFGPNCTTLHCGLQYRNQDQLRMGCTPLYVEGSCCPADWVCPGSPYVIPNDKHEVTGKESNTTHCSLGTWAALKGDALRMYDCHVSCLCLTPPYFTCVRYHTCTGAIAAQNGMYAP